MSYSPWSSYSPPDPSEPSPILRMVRRWIEKKLIQKGMEPLAAEVLGQKYSGSIDSPEVDEYIAAQLKEWLDKYPQNRKHVARYPDSGR